MVMILGLFLVAELLLIPHYRATVFVLGNVALLAGAVRGIWLSRRSSEPLRIAPARIGNVRIMRARCPAHRLTKQDESLRRVA